MNQSAVLPFTIGQAEKLSRAIRARTISTVAEAEIDRGEFTGFEEQLEKDFPLVHARLLKTRVGEFGLVYEWTGRNPSLLPGLLLAHYDVVPAREDDPGWQHGAWSGTIADDHIYGRGALDVKCTLISILEAAELLLAEGFTPERGMVFAFGGDEEMGGSRGARRIAAWFAERGLRFEYAVDEGSVVAAGMIAGIDKPLALIGIAEKGMMNVELRVKGVAGHASMPPEHTALGILASAIVRVEAAPSPARLTYTVENFLKCLAPEVKGPGRFVFSHPRAFWPLVHRALSANATTNALIRTTRALTMSQASSKENVLPDLARAIANVRILPGETRASAIEGLKRVIADPRVEVCGIPGFEGNDPIPETPIDSFAYSLTSKTISRLLPGVPIAPFLVTVSTDSKEYRDVTDHILRFTPVVLTWEEISTIHGVNERISFRNLQTCISFFYHMMKETWGGEA